MTKNPPSSYVIWITLTTVISKKKNFVLTYNNDFYFVLHELSQSTNQRKV